jgi:hypothetical protein
MPENFEHWRMSDSIFTRYYRKEPFVDRFERDSRDAIDIIIPVVHTNELWHANLTSIFREVPVRRLLISDGGCKDDSLEIARRFPRVEILDHRAYVSLGYSLRKLIEAVESEWFAYLHSDVYLPPGWFDAMKAHQAEYDWFGCPQRITALVEYPNVDILGGIPRPHAGSQMGRKAAFEPGVKEIDDDYVYRQEDLVLKELVVKHGFKAGDAEDIFHFHQMMHKESPWARKLASVAVKVEWSPEERIRASTMQIRGIVKYLQPSRPLALEVENHLRQLIAMGATTQKDFQHWIENTRPEWQSWIKPWRVSLMSLADRSRSRAGSILRRLRDR